MYNITSLFLNVRHVYKFISFYVTFFHFLRSFYDQSKHVYTSVLILDSASFDLMVKKLFDLVLNTIIIVTKYYIRLTNFNKVM